ncbi:phage major tail protein, TP901-1 family [Lacticaseibacillus mingshuiensis]|uniref:phage major tail protein, TP901-1 family n=1 Tax=Lacticaseibacillus mingshuiensis TaxID=2799574 RepID=UPI00194FBB5A|nr:phage major tail protein, TP901-1 family [Lacticaseibacillus mingshuiensis]
MANELAKVAGKDVVTFMRRYLTRATAKASLIPYQTGMTFGVSRDSDSTSTKDGPVNSQSSLETDFSVDFINNTSTIADEALDAAISGERIEAWKVNRGRRNATGQCEAWYVQGTISEDTGDNDSDDNATRSLTIAVDGEPKHGWVTLSDEQEELIDYVFHGLGLVAAADETDAKGVGEGTAWESTKDNGTNEVTASSSDPASTASGE